MGRLGRAAAPNPTRSEREMIPRRQVRNLQTRHKNLLPTGNNKTKTARPAGNRKGSNGIRRRQMETVVRVSAGTPRATPTAMAAGSRVMDRLPLKRRGVVAGEPEVLLIEYWIRKRH